MFPGTATIAVDIGELWRHLSIVDLVLSCRRPAAFDTGPSLAGRIRGALGWSLKHAIEAEPSVWRRRRRLFDLPSAFDLCFGQPLIAPSVSGPFLNPARPFLLFAAPAAAGFAVTLRLFGAATLYQRQILSAMHVALANGITIAPTARVKAAVSVIDARMHHRPIGAPEAPGGDAAAPR